MRYSKVIANLRKLAEACPLCGELQAENGKFTTKCPNIDCENFSLEKSLALDNMDLGKPSPVGTLEYKNNRFRFNLKDSLTSFVKLPVEDLRLPGPYIAELQSLVGDSVFVLDLKPFSSKQIPSSYKARFSGLFTKVQLRESFVYIADTSEFLYYCPDLFSMYDLLAGLNGIFSADFAEDAEPSKM